MEAAWRVVAGGHPLKPFWFVMHGSQSWFSQFASELSVDVVVFYVYIAATEFLGYHFYDVTSNSRGCATLQRN